MSTTLVEPKNTPVPGVRSGPSPEKFFETMVAYQRTAALKAAIDLDLFTAVGNGQRTISALAKQLKVGARRTHPLRRPCRHRFSDKGQGWLRIDGRFRVVHSTPILISHTQPTTPLATTGGLLAD
jgi:hypothetical protein